MDGAQQPGGRGQPLVGVLVIPAVTAVGALNEAQPLNTLDDTQRFGHGVETLAAQMPQQVMDGFTGR